MADVSGYIGAPLRRKEDVRLLRGEGCFAAEPVAAVVAADRYQAEDAAQDVEVGYDPLPVVASIDTALRPEAPALHPSAPDNIACAFELGTGDLEAALAEAD